MIEIIFAPAFLRQLKKIEQSLQDEILEKIVLFKIKDNHQSLKVHKLHGKFEDCLSFSINYNIRVVFQYIENDSVALLAVGDHDVYK